MPKILQDPNFQNNKKKYGHDMSQIKKFSSAVGQLLPVYYDFLYPGDSIRANTEMFTQVTDIVSPAMMHITEHVDWFFVPIKQICSIAQDKLFGIEDFKSSLIPSSAKNDNIQDIVPEFNMRSFADAIFQITQGNLSGQNTIIYNVIKGTETDDVQFDAVDEMGVPNTFNVMRLMELLGFSRKWFMMDNINELITNINGNLFTPIYAAAYQKIFFDNYRITDRTANDVDCYNFDSFLDTYEISDQVARNIFKLRYRAFRRDYFQLTKVSPLIDYGNIGMLDRPSEDSNNSLAIYNRFLGEDPAENIQGDDNYNKSINGAGLPNTATIRGMFAAEKLMEITRRAAKHYDAQVLAHFGFKLPQGVSDEVYRLGSEKSVLSVNEVFASAAGSASVDGQSVTTTLGQKGGRAAGYADAGRNIKFTAPCHGVLMAIYSAVPDSDYKPDGIDKLNTRLKRYDYFLPEFDRLGMQPFFGYESNFYPNISQDSFNQGIMGWQYRYQEFKLKYNIVHGAFNTKFKDWTIARDHFTFNKPTQYYIYPQFMDSVLLLSFQNADTDALSYNQCYARDYLLHWFKFNVYKSSIMSTYSLPSL